MPRRLTTEEFKRKCYEKYGNSFDFSEIEYVNQKTKVCVICPKHGEWMAWPNNLLRGHGCPACSGRERITPEIFIKRATEIHNQRYNYSLVDYKGLDKPVRIICPVHGEFEQLAKYHLGGNGCPLCYGTPKSSTEEFVEKAKAKYGELYDYSKVNYTGNKDKVKIICPKHGEWEVTPNNFLRGSRCPQCYGTPKLTTEEFIKKAKEIHGDKYDYSKVNYLSNKDKVLIICPEHGEFWQSPASHLKSSGCPECSGCKKITPESFIRKSKSTHKILYDYSKVQYLTSTDKVCIICPKHGEFWQSPLYHMHGGNCPKCVGGVKISKDDFIQKANIVHKNKYDYSKVAYINTSTKVCIICPEHGEFWQTPNNHLFGAGCPTCPQSNLEGGVREFLLKNKVNFIQEYSFDWLKYKKKLFLDFYLPEHKLAIECQGLQHFQPVEMFGGEDFFLKTIERDRLKKKLCEDHGIRIVYFSTAHIMYPYQVVETYKELLEIIKSSI